MNYLERLIRRALLEAPKNQGMPLADPFEAEAPWPLEIPDSSQGRVQPADNLAPISGDPDIPSENVQTFTENSRSKPAMAPEPVRATHPHFPEAWDRAEPQTPAMAIDRAIRAEPASPTIEEHALAQADDFMRALGVSLPSLSPEPPASAPRQNPPTETPVSEAIPSPGLHRVSDPESTPPKARTASAQSILPQPEAVFERDIPQNKARPQAEPAPSPPADQPRPAAANSPPPGPSVRLIAVPAATEPSDGPWLTKSARFGLGQL